MFLKMAQPSITQEGGSGGGGANYANVDTNFFSKLCTQSLSLILWQ